jgi:hypothetical protein
LRKLYLAKLFENHFFLNFFDQFPRFLDSLNNRLNRFLLHFFNYGLYFFNIKKNLILEYLFFLIYCLFGNEILQRYRQIRVVTVQDKPYHLRTKEEKLQQELEEKLEDERLDAERETFPTLVKIMLDIEEELLEYPSHALENIAIDIAIRKAKLRRYRRIFFF